MNISFQRNVLNTITGYPLKNRRYFSDCSFYSLSWGSPTILRAGVIHDVFITRSIKPFHDPNTPLPVISASLLTRVMRYHLAGLSELCRNRNIFQTKARARHTRCMIAYCSSSLRRRFELTSAQPTATIAANNRGGVVGYAGVCVCVCVFGCRCMRE